MDLLARILVLFPIIVSIVSQQVKEKCSHYVPGSDPSRQPKTYCSPKDFNWNCSIPIPGTTWHVLPGHISYGRCCYPVYGWNETFSICPSNGQPDQLTACSDGFHNWNTPFSSEKYTEVSEHASWVCRKHTPLTDLDIPRVTWNQAEFIVRKDKSITLLAKVHSSMNLVKVFLLRDNVQFPLSDPKISSVVSPQPYHNYIVHFTFSTATTSDGGQYYIVATNTHASGWSGLTRLTILEATNTHASGWSGLTRLTILKGTGGTTSGSPRIRSCMITIICMVYLTLLL